jgi:proteasome lid subunit RPN8/RPN11
VTEGSTVRLTRQAREAIVAHATREQPGECCGLLAGTSDVVDECVPARNMAASPTRYLIDPHDHIALNRRLRGTPRRVIGAYHSHPSSPAVPSATDIAEAQYPEFVWVIVSLAAADAPEIRAYRIDAGRFEEIAVSF